jgi:2-oxoglutarate ferredoxin oxidoreductase subunit beta
MTPVQSNKWLEENMLPYYPLGDLKTPDEKPVQQSKPE